MNAITGTPLILRRFERADVEQLYKYRNDPEFQRQLVGVSAGYSHKDLEDWIDYHRKVANEELWAIADAQSDQCVGQVGLYQINHRDRTAEFGIGIGFEEFQGGGNGTAVTRYVVDFGFRQLGLNKITLTVNSDNARAIAVYSRVGFQRDGLLRQEVWKDGAFLDVVVMSLLRDEWIS